MDEPGCSWPFWKFGMKRDDLSTKLQDEYNTIPSNIQDPEAFHHDVYEISRIADTADEFHRMMADRKEQRLKELNASLDLAAVEIIANPKLVGTGQWSYALQLFRTRSLDSLVRLFSSYLPDDYSCTQGYYATSLSGTSFSDRCSSRTASTNLSSLDDVDGPCFFNDDDEKPIMTHEPLHISTSISSSAITTELPPSPRSMTMQSDTSTSSPIDHERDYILHTLTPARTLSFSGSESGRFQGRRLQCLEDDEDEEEEDTSQSEDPDSLTTSVSDLDEHHLTRESTVDEEQPNEYTESATEDDDCEDEFPTTQLPFDLFDDVMESSETPTPKQEITTTITSAPASYLDSKSSFRSIPPSFRASSPKIPHLRRRDASPAKSSISSSTMSRRSPDEAACRIQKPQPDAARVRALAARERRRGLD
ncbi:hypothetical protein CH063_09595 [Colletotrichum higginsianum]|uniref:Uncharacterized protein n=2 Tax=Colletotrichum higginsianum TaxID=80884 RepID=H1VE80_COLHI|nr:hypothetical protein CH63R_05564 [Colletotrichum higginsianum IMI 349063]OBR09872.1 hypothetical protein CH63R_05564 [Colletotrichum higginsianum IMI 349063]TID06122.1 hypothetical protein CH35J_001535 [Colletotrichum higginsianum]CCF38533.1 hypothetical protein CH063_09595 [Colletotrichum higginsianum]